VFAGRRPPVFPERRYQAKFEGNYLIAFKRAVRILCNSI